MADIASGNDFNFVDIPFTPDATGMADDAVEVLRSSWPDWEPKDADPEVILIEAVAPMAAETESRASLMPAEALRTAGSKLYGVDYDNGTPAQTTVTLTFVDNAGGYVAPAGGQMNIDGFAFALISDAVAVAGSTTLVGVPVACTVNTADANALIGAIAVSLDLPPFVTGIAVDAPTSDGTEPMDDTSFLLKVVKKLRLRGDTLITAQDFALEATLQPGVGFAWASGNSARAIDVTVADPSGLAVPSGVKTALGAIYADPSVRSVNVTFAIHDPTYTTINVAYTVTANPSWAAADCQAQINVLLATLLSPQTAAKSGDPYIRKNVLIARIGSLQSVDFVETITLTTPTGGATVEANGDILMAGSVAALPILGTVTATVHT